MSSFLELLRSGEELDCELIIGDCEMPASFVWSKDSQITDYGIERYKPLMDAEYTRTTHGNIELHCPNWGLGEEFCLAAAGYISVSAYNRIFGTVIG